jgi:hypothetical protein
MIRIVRARREARSMCSSHLCACMTPHEHGSRTTGSAAVCRRSTQRTRRRDRQGNNKHTLRAIRAITGNARATGCGKHGAPCIVLLRLPARPSAALPLGCHHTLVPMPPASPCTPKSVHIPWRGTLTQLQLSPLAAGPRALNRAALNGRTESKQKIGCRGVQPGEESSSSTEGRGKGARRANGERLDRIEICCNPAAKQRRGRERRIAGAMRPAGRGNGVGISGWVAWRPEKRKRRPGSKSNEGCQDFRFDGG